MHEVKLKQRLARQGFKTPEWEKVHFVNYFNITSVFCYLTVKSNEESACNKLVSLFPIKL